MKQKRIFKQQSLFIIAQQGFTIMEFLVASILGLIVILAVGAAYTATARLDQRGAERLAIQQDVRASTTMIMRDAHMAGNFGCLSLANAAYGAKVNINDSYSSLTGPYKVKTGDYGVQAISSVPVTGFTLVTGSKALMFHYGVGSATLNSLEVSSGRITKATFIADKTTQKDLLKNARGYLVLASCSRMDVVTGAVTGNNISAGVGLPIGNQTDILQTKNFHTANNLEVMRFMIHIYAVGTYNGQLGLYRIALGNNKTWDTPQLLSPYVTSMKFRFGYSNPAKCSDDVGAGLEDFTFADAIKPDYPPSLLWLQLNVSGESGAQVDEHDDTRTSIYKTTATIRGGNICASRSLQQTTTP